MVAATYFSTSSALGYTTESLAVAETVAEAVAETVAETAAKQRGE